MLKSLTKNHSDTTTDIVYSLRSDSNRNPKFMRFDCCLGPLKKGFRKGCRPIIALDECYIKRQYPDQLLITIGAYSSNG